jgi:hypothetical protein
MCKNKMMREIFSTTIKYYRLAIFKFLPYIKKLETESKNESVKERLRDLIDMYNDIGTKIDKFHLNLQDPNKIYEDEPFEISFNELGIDDKRHEYFSRLVLNLLNKWKEEKNKLEKKEYLTEKNERELDRLTNLIWPLEAQFNNGGRLFYTYKEKGPIEFPKEEENESSLIKDDFDEGLFPIGLLEKIHPDIRKICNEFNLCYKNNQADASLLLLRKILPLSIVRRFQQLGLEEQIKKDDKFLETAQLLGKAKTILSDKNIYDKIIGDKIIIDANQHNFTFKPRMLDVKNTGNTIRVFLEDLFFRKEE